MPLANFNQTDLIFLFFLSGADASAFSSLLDPSVLSNTGGNSSLNTTNNSASNDSNAGTGSTEKDPVTNKYTCSRCGRSYLHQATLVRHQRYECGITASYPCNLCGRKFKRRDVLKGHMEKCMNKAQAAAAVASGLAVTPSGPVPPPPSGSVSPPSMVGTVSPFLQPPEEASKMP